MLRGILRDNRVTIVGGREVPEIIIVGPFAIPARNRPVPLFRSMGGPGDVTQALARSTFGGSGTSSGGGG